MRKVMLSALFFFYLSFSYCQGTINLGLKRELDSIYVVDQEYRDLLSTNIFITRADSLAAVYKVPAKDLLSFLINSMNRTDSSNMVRIDEILKQYGYPGKSLVGEPTNEAVFYVIQHSQSIDRYIDVIKNATDKKELSFKLYAMMLDRSLMYNGREQIYGTQAKGFQMINATTGIKEFTTIVWPIKDAATVNERRKKAGFNDTVEENAKSLGIDYKVFTLDDFKKMQGN